jgi:arsenite methyltransferase
VTSVPVQSVDPAYLKACCADVWAHPGVRLLAGEALHPGGRALTERLLSLVSLHEGARLIDVGSGPGGTLAIAAERGIRAVGVDLSAWGAPEDTAAMFACADAERLPFREGSFDGALLECVLSVIPNKPDAIRELRRVVRRGGRVALADVTLSGALPVELSSLLGWIACTAGALHPTAYVQILSDAGFEPVLVEDHRDALAAMVDKARRRLAMIQGAVGTGLLDLGDVGLAAGLLELGRQVLDIAASAVADGILGYVLITAEQ